MKIINHRLYHDDNTPYPFRPTPNMSKTLKPEYLIMHYTASSNAEDAIRWLTNSRVKASAHLVIARDGNITQLVPFDTRAWHAGRSSWQGLSGLNKYSIGIELDNAGPLTRSYNGQWLTWSNDPINDDQVTELLVHKNENVLRHWHMYSKEQLLVAREVAVLLREHYHLKDIIGHDDVAPGRKIDPGPAFPMESFRSSLFGRVNDESDEEVFYTTVTLNIRTGPGTQYETLSAGPLPRGTRVVLLAGSGSWKQVDVLGEVRGVIDIQGWVHKRFIEPI